MNFSDTGFSNYDSLRNLDISNMGIPMLKSSWFSRKSIEVLDVSRNQLTELKKENVKFFPKLRVFNASNNELKFLEGGTFSESKRIEVINLANNHIPGVHFEDLDNLRILNLKSNAITVVFIVQNFKCCQLS
jgi:Leucine-rich repeat (LRR) protein